MPVLAPTPITLLYTVGLSGQLALLPRLFTRIRQERAASPGIAFLVDLGRACVNQTWVCEATGGLGMLVAMDGMGYDAFHIGPQDALYTQPQQVQRLRETIATPLAAGPWTAAVHRRDLDVIFTSNEERITEVPSLAITLQLSDTPALQTGWRNGYPALLLDAGWLKNEPLLARLDVMLLPDDPYIQANSPIYLTISDDLIPDPTITSVIEFVESEARRYQDHRADRKHSGG